MNSKHYISASPKQSDYMLYSPPPVVGYICLSPNFKIGMTKKPNWFHLKMIRLVFGWVWEDIIMENVNERTNAVGGKISSS
jgi:hypothetical protein